jgi:hypothetical protein
LSLSQIKPLIDFSAPQNLCGPPERGEDKLI